MPKSRRLSFLGSSGPDPTPTPAPPSTANDESNVNGNTGAFTPKRMLHRAAGLLNSKGEPVPAVAETIMALEKAAAAAAAAHCIQDLPSHDAKAGHHRPLPHHHTSSPLPSRTCATTASNNGNTGIGNNEEDDHHLGSGNGGLLMRRKSDSSASFASGIRRKLEKVRDVSAGVVRKTSLTVKRRSMGANDSAAAAWVVVPHGDQAAPTTLLELTPSPVSTTTPFSSPTPRSGYSSSSSTSSTSSYSPATSTAKIGANNGVGGGGTATTATDDRDRCAPVMHAPRPRKHIRSLSHHAVIPEDLEPPPLTPAPHSPPGVVVVVAVPSDPRNSPTSHHHNLNPHDHNVFNPLGDPDRNNSPPPTIRFKMDDVKVPPLLQQGVPMMKVSAKKQKRYIFRLDPDQGHIVWESKKLRIIPIEYIKELRSGADARYYRAQFQLAQEYEDRWLTIVYILDGGYETLHLIAATKDIFQMWDITLRKLHDIRVQLMSGLGNFEMRQAVWEKQFWKGADEEDGNQKLEFEDVEKMCRRLNINPSRDDLLRRFKQADVQNRGYLDFNNFRRFVKALKARPELDRLYKKLSKDTGGLLTYEAFERFMRTYQKSSAEDEDLKRVFVKYASSTISGQTASTPDASPPQNPLDFAVSAAAAQVSATDATPDAPPPIPPKDSPSASPPLPPVPIPAAVPAPTSASVPAAPSTHPTSTASLALASPSAPALATFPSTATTTTITGGVTTSGSTSGITWENGVMSLKGFTSFLLSSDNAAFADQNGKIAHDMTKPLPEYFISSSHNTYLVGHQLVGDSTIEGYIRALLHSCRSVELDIYDGDKEPVIYHGRTLTTKVSLRDACQAIAKYAFVASPYPIIISAEVHCGITQQALIADIMREVFGEALVSAPVDERPKIEELPSPEQLRGKVLLKAKNLYVAEGEGVREKDVSVDTESSSTETSASDTDLKEEIKQEWRKARVNEAEMIKDLKSDLKSEFRKARNVLHRVSVRRNSNSGLIGSPPKSSLLSADTSTSHSLSAPSTPMSTPSTIAIASSSSTSTTTTTVAGTANPRSKDKVKMSFELVSLLVYTVGVKCRGLNKKEVYAPEHVFSLSETTANRVLKQSMMDLIKHNRTHVVRIYPKGMRIGSTNYEPHRYWSAGAQLVALNWQTFDLGYMINHAMFQRNGRAGYVLKPLALRTTDKQLMSKRTQHFLDVKIISAQQLPRPKDSLGREIIDKSILDPFVEVSIHIPDWTSSPFLPEDTDENSTNVDDPTAITPSSSPSAISTSALASRFKPKPKAKKTKAKVVYSPPTGASMTSATSARTLTVKTCAVKNNGFNPVWEQSLSLPFDCVGDMKDLIFVRFAVKQEDKDDDEPLAVYCVSLGSLNLGYRHLPLHDTQLSQYLFSTLFVKVDIRDV